VIIQALSWSILLREKILSQYPNSNIVDIIIQRRQTTQEIETKESVTLIEISIHTAIPGKIVGRSKEPLNELKDLLERLRKTARI
jgi:ribosomal protein S3